MTYKQYAAQMRGYMQEPMSESAFNKMMNIGEEEIPPFILTKRNGVKVDPKFNEYLKLKK